MTCDQRQTLQHNCTERLKLLFDGFSLTVHLRYFLPQRVFRRGACPDLAAQRSYRAFGSLQTLSKFCDLHQRGTELSECGAYSNGALLS
jgi:hypothetical protein